MENFDRILKKIELEEPISEELKLDVNNSVYTYEPGIIYLKEAEEPEAERIALMIKRILLLGSQFDKYGVIIDLRDANRPDAKARRMLNETFSEVTPNTVHVSFLTNGIILNTAIRFVMFGIRYNSYSIDSSLEDAVNAIREALK